MLSNSWPKPTRRLVDKLAKRAAEMKAQRECYAKVDLREEWHCRVTDVNVNPWAVSMADRGHHHHMVYRSRGGRHETNNVILVSAKTHLAIHNGKIRTTGDADVVRGVLLERYVKGGWKAERWI